MRVLLNKNEKIHVITRRLFEGDLRRPFAGEVVEGNDVGAGVLVISLSYGIGGPIVTVALLSLALNLVMTGFFIAMVKRLIANSQPAFVGGMENR